MSPFIHEEQLCALFTIIAQQRVGKRPGRVQPRAIKSPKAYPLLMVLRVKARQAVLDRTWQSKEA